MKTPKFQPLARAAAAVSIVLAGTFFAVPATAQTDKIPTQASPSPAPAAAPAAAAGISDAGLAAAVRRDLNMSLPEFNAAGAQARRAADAVPTLRGIPGYVGTSLAGGKIVVEGTGPGLQARVAELNQDGPAEFVLATPAGAPPAATAGPADPAAGVHPSAGLLAASTQQLFEAYVRDVGSTGLQAVVYADGRFIIRTGAANLTDAGSPEQQPADGGRSTPPAASAATKISPAAFVARYANVALEQGAPISTEEDFFGGQGLIVDGSTLCSAGFGAFSNTGDPVVLTAGHCAADGAATEAAVELPSDAAAASGAGSGAASGGLGTFGFSQFGGPGNSRVEDDGTNTGTDIAVLESIREGLRLQPAVTRWDNPADPGPTAVKILGTVAPFPGQPVCRSGRSLGWSCGTVDTVGIWTVGGPNNVPDGADLRALNGFDSTSIKSRSGDSGGPWISGNFAVGTHTGSEGSGDAQVRAIATTLADALARIPGGVELQLFLNKPVPAIPAGGTVTAGEPITGYVPASPAATVAPHSNVRITVPGEAPFEVPVDGSGQWTFPAPAAAGTFSFSAETVNGFSRSGAAAGEVRITDLTAPVITAPAEGWQLAGVDVVEGTGEPGRTLTLSGSVQGSGVVGDDGRWSIPVGNQPVYGKLSVAAVLSAPGHPDSPPAGRAFTVLPPAPAVASLPDGLHFPPNGLPASISGTGIDGADVAVVIDGSLVGAGPVGTGSGATGVKGADGFAPARAASDGASAPQAASGAGSAAAWSVPFPAGIAAGPHTLSVTQTIDGVTSAPAVSAFIVDAPSPVAPPGAAPPAAAPPVVPPVPAAPAVAPGPAAASSVTDAQGEAPHAAVPAAAGTSVAEQPAAAPLTAAVPAADQPAGDSPATASAPTAPAAAAAPGASGGTGGRSEAGDSGLVPVAAVGAGVLLLGTLLIVFGRRRTRS